ncbi:hypothetical protein AAMO2058_001482300 [Amorphochlora amoebiformis]
METEIDSTMRRRKSNGEVKRGSTNLKSLVVQNQVARDSGVQNVSPVSGSFLLPSRNSIETVRHGTPRNAVREDDFPRKKFCRIRTSSMGNQATLKGCDHYLA